MPWRIHVWARGDRARASERARARDADA
eukprot:COSAG02_NODE_52148_length_309_cov_1.228571_1_plen_27_part_01